MGFTGHPPGGAAFGSGSVVDVVEVDVVVSGGNVVDGDAGSAGAAGTVVVGAVEAPGTVVVVEVATVVAAPFGTVVVVAPPTVVLGGAFGTVVGVGAEGGGSAE